MEDTLSELLIQLQGYVLPTLQKLFLDRWWCSDVRTVYVGYHFDAPFNEDNGSRNSPYQLSSLAVMAGDEETDIQVNGRRQKILKQGENTIIRVNQGDTLSSTKPVLAGDIDSRYELRWYSLAPTEKWSNEYYAPVGGTKGTVKVSVYNPSSEQIKVTVTSGGKTGTLTVKSRKLAMSGVIKDGNAAKVESDGTFFAWSMTDATTRSGEIYDWSYPLMSKEHRRRYHWFRPWVH